MLSEAPAVTSQLRSYELGGNLVFELSGEHDMATIPEIEPAIIAATNGQPRVVFNLTQCKYVDSSMLSMLIREHALLGERMTIVVPRGGNIGRIFEIARIDHLIKTVHSVDEALAER